MAKAEKGKAIAVKKAEPPAVAPSRMLSPWRTWEREVERMFEDFFRWPRFRGLEPFRFPGELRLKAPALDLYEEKDEVVVKAEVPGMTKDDIEVTVSDSTLILKGEKKKEEEIKEKDYYRCEREYGSFLRSVDLPVAVKTEGAKATFKDGVLEVRLQKSEEAKKKTIEVKVQ